MSDDNHEHGDGCTCGLNIDRLMHASKLAQARRNAAVHLGPGSALKRPHLFRLDDHGEPVPFPDTNEGLWAWAAWMQDAHERYALVIAADLGPTEIVTWFTGVDPMCGFGSGPQMLWQTDVITNGRITNGERYATRAEALAGHARYADANK